MKKITIEEAHIKWDFDASSMMFAYNQAVEEANNEIANATKFFHIAVIEKVMREYGAIPTDWRHFWDDLRSENKKYLSF